MSCIRQVNPILNHLPLHIYAIMRPGSPALPHRSYPAGQLLASQGELYQKPHPCPTALHRTAPQGLDSSTRLGSLVVVRKHNMEPDPPDTTAFPRKSVFGSNFSPTNCSPLANGRRRDYLTSTRVHKEASVLEHTSIQNRIRLGPLRRCSTLLLPHHLPMPSVDAASHGPPPLPYYQRLRQWLFSSHSSSSCFHKPIGLE